MIADQQKEKATPQASSRSRAWFHIPCSHQSFWSYCLSIVLRPGNRSTASMHVDATFFPNVWSRRRHKSPLYPNVRSARFSQTNSLFTSTLHPVLRYQLTAAALWSCLQVCMPFHVSLVDSLLPMVFKGAKKNHVECASVVSHHYH